MKKYTFFLLQLLLVQLLAQTSAIVPTQLTISTPPNDVKPPVDPSIPAAITSPITPDPTKPVATAETSSTAAPICPLGSAGVAGSLQAGSVTISNKGETGVQTYSYPLEEHFQAKGRDFSVSVSMSSFNARFNEAISFSISSTNSTRPGYSLTFSASSNTQWTNMRLSFLATSRPDLEIGSALFDSASPDCSPGYITYALKTNWLNPDYLRINYFLSEFEGDSRGNSIGYLVTGRQLQAKLVIFKFVQNATTNIRRLKLDIVIFESNNPAFRFQEGLITETYLSAVMVTQIPPPLDGQSRSALVGLSSFILETDTQFSLFSELESDTFALKVGPLHDGCFFQYLSFTYLLLSVNKCGFCRGSYFLLNDTCVGECPLGTRAGKGSRCEPIICEKAQYINSSNRCAPCPRHSNIPICDNACQEDEYLVGEDCIKKCNTADWQIYNKGKCVCMEGYFNISGSCGQCEEGTYYDAASQSCKTICLAHQYYDKSTKSCPCIEGYVLTNSLCQPCPPNFVYQTLTKSCVCKEGLYLIGPRCGICMDSENYNLTARQCDPKCAFPELYYKGDCICPPAFIRAKNSTCVYCPPGTKLDDSTQDCLSICTKKEVYRVDKCVCAEGFYILKGICDKCGTGLMHDLYLDICRIPCNPNQVYNASADLCQCAPGFYFIGRECSTCPPYSSYNPTIQGCECQAGYVMGNGSCRSICPFVNQRYDPVSGGCKCVEATYNISNRCGTCPPNSAYSPQLQACPCNEGYQLNQLNKYSCEPLCSINQIYVNDRCVCASGFFLINGQCTLCPSGQIYDSLRGLCQLPCGLNQIFDQTQQKCLCLSGYYPIRGICGVCDITQYYDSGSQTCLNKCPSKNQIYDPKTKRCVCAPNFYLVDGSCLVCPKDYFFDTTSLKCVRNCLKNEVYNPLTGKCQCLPNYFPINGQCGQCRQGELYDLTLLLCVPKCADANSYYSFVQGKCICKDGSGLVAGYCILCGANTAIDDNTQECRCKAGFYLISGQCATCPPALTYNPATQLCSCPPNYLLSNDQCLPPCPSDQYYSQSNSTCLCLDGESILYNGTCIKRLNCPPNSAFHPATYCCLCNIGFRLRDGECVVNPACGAHGYDYNGLCVCNSGYYMVDSLCQTCKSNEVYNGLACQCLAGYSRNPSGFCTRNALPSCAANQIYDSAQQKCVCLNGYQFLFGSCQIVPNCPAFSNWNGEQCQCQQGYLMKYGKCAVVNQTVPACPQNSEFNGVSCVCRAGLHEVSQGVCGQCESGYNWNGRECVSSSQCDEGFAMSPFSFTCVPVGQLCGQGARWSGVTCCCLPGYHNIDNRCVQCPANTSFDGQQCSPTLSKTTCSSNQILVSSKCSCVAGFYPINGVCTECPEYTTWNGAYCECKSSDPATWCMGIPFSSNLNGQCQCQTGYLKVNGLCLKA